MSCCHVVSCRSSGSRVRNCKLFNEGTCPRQSSMQQKTWLILPVVICLSHWLSCSKKEFEVRFLPGPPNCVFPISEASPEPRRVQPTKKWPRKKKNGKLGKTTTLARGRAADPGGPALLLSPGPAASQQGLRRGAQRLHPAAQRAEEACALLAGRRAPADQAGQGLLPRQYLVHAGAEGAAGGTPAGYERRDWLPVNELGGAMTRHPAHLTEELPAAL